MHVSAAAFKIEHVAPAPRGWKVRTVRPSGSSRHEVRVAFPPGRRRKGTGKVVEILHPKSENNPRCAISEKARTNPGELLIFGNPAARRGQGNPSGKGFGNHKPGCGCKFCDRARKLQSGELKPPPLPNRRKKNSKKLEAQRAARERAEQIRKARLTRGARFRDVGLGNPKRATQRRRRADRRNPGGGTSDTKEAVRLFQGFHGHDPKEIAEKHVSAAVRLDYAAIGDLLYAKTRTPLGAKAEWDFRDDGVKLASSPDGKQLYCIGGNQNILSLLDERSKEKDFIDLGECLEVAYLARKVHGDFRPIEYYHEFGEINGSRPRLMFDKVRKQLFFIGGDYFIDVNVRAPGTPLGKVSPGIEN